MFVLKKTTEKNLKEKKEKFSRCFFRATRPLSDEGQGFENREARTPTALSAGARRQGSTADVTFVTSQFSIYASVSER